MLPNGAKEEVKFFIRRKTQKIKKAEATTPKSVQSADGFWRQRDNYLLKLSTLIKQYLLPKGISTFLMPKIATI